MRRPGLFTRPRLLDYVSLLIGILVVLAVSLQVYGASGSGTPQVLIQGSDRTWVYPLGTDLQVHVPGPLGDTDVIIRDGRVFVSESPCTEKICIATGAISSPGSWIACLPNRVFVKVERSGENEVDAGSF